VCTKKPLWKEFSLPKTPQKPGNALSDALLISCFQKMAAGAAKKKTALFFETAHIKERGFNQFINSSINEGGQRLCKLNSTENPHSIERFSTLP